jgi:hypothetical protein
MKYNEKPETEARANAIREKFFGNQGDGSN